MKDWLASWLTGGKLRQLEQEARNAEEWGKHMEGVRDVLAAELDWALTECANAKNALAELGIERDGLLEQMRTLASERDAAKTEAKNQFHRANDQQAYINTMSDQQDKVANDRQLLLAHAVRLYERVRFAKWLANCRYESRGCRQSESVIIS